ncbi:hypothetical protein DFH09DRAFT_1085478 [Mycena vulgaris]|nr:hypothetical protein DFH09DRAFT_1085478 [Mycena vulgaris]
MGRTAAFTDAGYSILATVNIGMKRESTFQAATRWTSRYTELTTYEILRDWSTYLNCLEAIQAPVGSVLNPRVSSNDVQSRQYLARDRPNLNKFGDQESMLWSRPRFIYWPSKPSEPGRGISSPKLSDTRHGGPASSKCNIAGCLTSASNSGDVAAIQCRPSERNVPVAIHARQEQAPPPFRLSGGCGGVIVFDGVAGTVGTPPYSTAPGWNNAPMAVQAQHELRQCHHVRRLDGAAAPTGPHLHARATVQGVAAHMKVHKCGGDCSGATVFNGVRLGGGFGGITIIGRDLKGNTQPRPSRLGGAAAAFTIIGRRPDERNPPPRPFRLGRGCGGVTVNRRRPDENTHPRPFRLGGAAAASPLGGAAAASPSIDGARMKTRTRGRSGSAGAAAASPSIDGARMKTRTRGRSGSAGLRRLGGAAAVSPSIDGARLKHAPVAVQARRGCGDVTVNRRRPIKNTSPRPFRLGGAAVAPPSFDSARMKTPPAAVEVRRGCGDVTVIGRCGSGSLGAAAASQWSTASGARCAPATVQARWDCNGLNVSGGAEKKKSAPATVQARQGRGGITVFGDAGTNGNEPAAIRRSSVKVVLGVPVRYRVDVIARQELDPRRNTEPSSRKKGKEE